VNKVLFNIIILLGVLYTTLPAQDKIYFDIKTESNQKLKMLPIEVGIMFYFMRSDWAGTLELGEDFTLWIINYQKFQSGDLVYVNYIVELRYPSLFRAKELILAKKVNLQYNPNEIEVAEASLLSAIQRKVNILNDDVYREISVVGQATLEVARKMMEELKIPIHIVKTDSTSE
jgi:hypothetical protein